jgi:hypothetical protein
MLKPKSKATTLDTTSQYAIASGPVLNDRPTKRKSKAPQTKFQIVPAMVYMEAEHLDVAKKEPAIKPRCNRWR